MELPKAVENGGDGGDSGPQQDNIVSTCFNMFQHVSTCFNKILGVPVQLRGLILYPTYSEHHQLVDESLKAIKVDFATCL